MSNFIIFSLIFLVSSVFAFSVDLEPWIVETIHDIFKSSRYEKHMPVLTSFKREGDSKLEVVLSVFDYTVAPRLQGQLKEAVESVQDKKISEDLVVWIEVTQEEGSVIHQEQFWDDEERDESDNFQMPYRKDYGEGYRIKIPLKFELNADIKTLPTRLQTYAFSREHGLVDGLPYIVDWEVKAEEVRAKALSMKKYFEYDLEKLGNKHVPSITFDEESNARFYVKHKQDDEGEKDHSISVIFAEDEFGRVVFYKEFSEKSYESVMLTFDHYEEIREYHTLTPYSFCSKHGLYQGKTTLITTDDDGEEDTGGTEIVTEPKTNRNHDEL